MTVRITCIIKNDTNNENRYTSISELGWIEESTRKKGMVTRKKMCDFLQYEKGKAYVKDIYGNIAYLMREVTYRGTEYVKTVADETKSDNLLSLSRC